MEVIAVLFIIALAAALVVVSLPPQTGKASDAATSLSVSLMRMSEEAILTGSPHGLVIRDGAPVFQRLSNGAWQNLADQKQWPEGDARLEMQIVAAVQGDDEEPRLVAFPDGAMTPAQLILHTGGERARLSVSLSGGVAWERQ